MFTIYATADGMNEFMVTKTDTIPDAITIVRMVETGGFNARVSMYDKIKKQNYETL